MALHVIDRCPSPLENLFQLLRPEPGRLAFALRLALICALTTLVVEIYQTPEPAITVYVVFFLNKPDRSLSLVLTAVMLVVITVVIGFVLLTTIAVIDQPAWRVAAIAAISFSLLFMSSASKLRPIGNTVALIVGYALDLLGTAHLGEIAARALLYAWLFAGIPAGVSIVTNLLLAPSPRKLAERAIAERLRIAATLLRGLDENVRDDFSRLIDEGMSEILTWLTLAAAEKTSPARDMAAMRQAAESTTAILLLVEVIDRDRDHIFPRLCRLSVARSLDEMASIFQAGGYPVDVTYEPTADDAALPATALALLIEIRATLAQFTEKPLPDLPPQPKAKTGGFFLPDAFTNPEHIRYALKTTAAAMFCYILYSLLDWPGIHTCFITCYIVSLGTTAETVEKLSLRILGCLFGAAVGIAAIVFILPALTSIEALMAIVFLGTFMGGWVAAGNPRISYAGFQIAFAFFLCVIQGSTPAFDMTIARDRVIGILLGNVVVYLVFTNIWPVSLGKKIDPAITALLRRMSAMLSAPDLSARRLLALQAQTELEHVKSELDLIKFEPPTIRPSADWLAARSRALQEINALEAPLFLSAGRDFEFSADLARRLDAMADSFDPANPTLKDEVDAVALGKRTDTTPSPFQHLIEPHLQGLQHALARRPDAERMLGNAAA